MCEKKSRGSTQSATRGEWLSARQVALTVARLPKERSLISCSLNRLLKTVFFLQTGRASSTGAQLCGALNYFYMAEIDFFTRSRALQNSGAIPRIGTLNLQRAPNTNNISHLNRTKKIKHKKKSTINSSIIITT